MDIERIRGWTWNIANKLIEAGETRTLERFLIDLRSSNLPHEFANVIVNSMTVFRKSGIDTGEIPFDLQFFNYVTEFKQAKAVVIATIHNTLVREKLWGKIKELLDQKLSPESIAKRVSTSPDYVLKIIREKGGEV